jgi:primosomal protein N' (replication factor Y)
LLTTWRNKQQTGYIKLIEEYLNTGKQILYLLPEIAFFLSISGWLRTCFGNKVAVYHSKYNNEQVKFGIKFKKKIQARVVIGARSALFYHSFDLGFVC